MHASDFEFQHRKSNRQKYERNRNGKPFGTGVEKPLAKVEQKPHQTAESERKHDFEQRLYDDRNDVHDARNERFCYAERNGEEHQTHRVVEGDDGEKDIRQRSFGFVLFNDHERCRGRGCGSDCPERDRRGKREFFGDNQMQKYKRCVHDQRGDDGLKNAYDRRLFTNFFELRKSEFVADRKGDKAESNVAKNGEGFNLFHARKTEPRNI